MSKRVNKWALAAAVVSVATNAHAGLPVFPTFSFGLGFQETNAAAGTALGSTSTLGGNIEQLNAAGLGTSVPADGQFHTITFTFGNDLVTTPPLTGGNGMVDAANGLAEFEHLRINNESGVTKPTSIFIDDVTTDGMLIADFERQLTTATPDAAIPPNTSIVGFREATFSSTTNANLGRNFNSSTAVNTLPDPDGAGPELPPTGQAARVNLRFNTPEISPTPGGTTGWIRLVTSATSALGPVAPVIAVGSGKTLTLRIAIVINDPLYGYNPLSGNDEWLDDGNWGRGTAEATTNAPNSSTATALFDEPLPEVGPPVGRTVNITNSDVKMNVFQITTAVPYTFNGNGQILVTRNGTTIPPVIDVEAGSHTVNVPVNFNIDSGAQDTTFAPLVFIASGASLTATQPFTVTKYVLSGATETASITKRGAGLLSVPDLDLTTLSISGGTVKMNAALANTITTVSLGSATPNAPQLTNYATKLDITPSAGATKTVTTLSVNAGGNPSATRTLAGDFTNGNLDVGTMNIGVNATVALDFAGKSAAKFNSIGFNVTATVVTAKLDLGNDGILYDYTNVAVPEAVRNNIILAYNGGLWDGKGYTSSLLPAASKYGIGYRGLLTGEAFMNRTATDDTTLGIRYTLKGDGDVDGDVDFDDLLTLAQNYDPAFVPTPTEFRNWINGDSNYDGKVDFDDLLSLAQNYNGTAIDAGALGSGFAADWALAQSLVPEPTTLGLLGGLGLAALRRRR